MDDPTFPAVITVGGSGQTYRFSALPKEIHANQSFILTAVLSESAAPFDISGSTATLYVAGWKNEVPPVQLAVGSLSDSGGGTTDKVTFTVIKDLIPDIFGYLPLRKSGNSVFYFTLTDANSTLQFFQTVNIIDSDYSLSGDVQPSSNVIIPVRNDLGNVVSVNLNTPPVSPALQDSYIIGTSPTGAWVGQNNDLTVWNGTAWVFYDTTEGNFVFDETASQQYTFSGVTWAPTAAITYADGEFIVDDNGNELVQFGVISSAVNHPKFSNAATGNPAIIEAVGGDTNVDLLLHGQAAGNVKIADGTDNTKIIDVVASTIATGTTRTLTMPNANVDLTNVNSALQNIVEDTTPQLGGTLDAQNNYISSLLGIGAKTSATLTISTGAVTQTQLVHAIANESAAATDDLNTIVPATGQTDLFLTMSASGQVPTIKHAAGTNTFLLASDTDLEMVMNTIYHFRHDGTNWKLAGSGASGGGGGVETLIHTEEITSSVASVSFSIPDSSTYRRLRLEWDLEHVAGGSYVNMTMKLTLNGTQYSSGYKSTGQSRSTSSGYGSNITTGIYLAFGVANADDEQSGHLIINNETGTKRKGYGEYCSAVGNGYVGGASAFAYDGTDDTEPVDAVEITADTNLTGGKIRVYGVND